jgi:hypothetical protein
MMERRSPYSPPGWHFQRGPARDFMALRRQLMLFDSAFLVYTTGRNR